MTLFENCRRLTGLVAAAAVVTMAASTGLGQVTSFWNGGAGSWFSGSNWSTGTSPNSALHDVFIDSGNSLDSTVTLSSDATVGKLTIDAGDQLLIDNNRWFTIAAGSFGGSGNCVVNGVLANQGSLSAIRFSGTNQGFNLSGSGVVNLGGGHLMGVGSNNTLTNQTTITGSGHLSGMDFVNQGSILATGAAGININPTTSFINQGTLTATAGSKVTFGAGTYSNSGQWMTADGAGAQLHFGSGVIQGGGLRGINGGEVLLQNDNLVLDGTNALTLNGQIRVADNYWPYLRGDIFNQGTITTGTSSALRIAAGESARLTNYGGSGELILNNAHVSGFAGSQFTNDYSHTIRGSGTIGVENTTNNGTILATGATGITLASTNFTNYGNVIANAGSKVTRGTGTLINNGTITADGAGAQLHFSSAGTVRGGTLRGINGGEVLFQSDNLLLDGETNGSIVLQGQSRIANNYWPYVKGTIDNQGTIATGPSSILRMHSGESATLTSSTYSGQLVLDNAIVSGFGGGSQLTNGSGHTIRGTGWLGLSSINLVNEGTLGGDSGTLNVAPQSFFRNGLFGNVRAEFGGATNFTTGTIINNGTFLAGAGSSINLTGSASLYGYDSGVLQNGYYQIVDDGQMNLNIGSIHTLENSSVELIGATATFAPINTLQTLNGGSIAVRNGKVFGTAGGLTNSSGWVVVGDNGSSFTVNGTFDNSGGVVVEQGGTFDAPFGFSPQYHAGTKSLNGGFWSIGGVARYAGGSIEQLNASIILTSPTAQFLQSNNASAISGLNYVGASGHLGVQGNMWFTGPSSFTNEGLVTLGAGAGSTGGISLPGSYTQNAGTTRLYDGRIDAGGGIFIDGGTVSGYGTLAPGGTTPTVTIDGVISPGIYNLTYGYLAVEGRLGFATDSVYEWSLMQLRDNSSGWGGWDWDLIQVEDGIFGGNVILEFGDWLVAGPDQSLGFWHDDHEWTIATALSGGILNSFSLAQSDYNFGSFSLGIVNSGPESYLRLYYLANGVPEPTTAGFLAIGLIALALVRRRAR